MQFALVLAVVAALVIAENSPAQPVSDAGLRLTLAVAAMAAVGVFAAAGSARAARQLRTAGGPCAAMRRFRRFRQVHLALWLAAAGFVLYGLKWGQLVRHNWHLDQALLVDEILILAPIVLPLLASWAAFYEVDRAIRLLAAGDGPIEVPGRKEYVALQARYYLGVLLVPVLGLLAVQDCLQRFWPESLRGGSPLSAIVLAPSLLAVLALFPWLLRHIWQSRPLPSGPLRERLEQAARRAGFQIREILVWQTGGMVANAAVAGFLPGLRYVFLSDGLLSQLTEEQVEAVFGHEAGHVCHRHLLFRVLAMVTPLSAWVLLEQLYPEAPALVAAWLGGGDVGSQIRFGLAMLAIMAVYVLLVFGAYSRMLEGQADLFGCRALAADPGARAVETFVSALEKLAAVSGVDRNAPSWQHASIARRVEFLNRIASDPLYEQWFQRRLRAFGTVLTGIVVSPVAYRLLLG